MSDVGSGNGRLADFEALLRSVDNDAPLGTDEVNPDGATPEQVQFWVHTYREVVEHETKMLDTVMNLLPMLGARARKEAEETNVPLIAGQLARFRFRLRLWEERDRILRTGKA